jgi:site-specific recombinase XerD
MKAIAPILPGPNSLTVLPAALTAPLRLAADFARASKAPATQAAYDSDFRLFEAWCAARGISALPATAAALCGFLADEAAAGRRASTVKAGAAKLGLEASAFAGHSLRAGFVTSAVKRGANLIKITDVTGHRSLEMLKTYSRDAEAFVGHAGAGLL